jgi:hypothetical protein
MFCFIQVALFEGSTLIIAENETIKEYPAVKVERRNTDYERAIKNTEKDFPVR